MDFDAVAMAQSACSLNLQLYANVRVGGGVGLLVFLLPAGSRLLQTREERTDHWIPSQFLHMDLLEIGPGIDF
jgi:hypothetical protein